MSDKPDKQIDLSLDNYRVQTKRGRFITRDNWPLYFLWCGSITAGFLIWGWWNRSELGPASLYGLCAFVSFGFGIGVGGFLKRFD